MMNRAIGHEVAFKPVWAEVLMALWHVVNLFLIFFYCMYSIWNWVILHNRHLCTPKGPFFCLYYFCTSIYELPFLAIIAFELGLTNKCGIHHG